MTPGTKKGAERGGGRGTLRRRLRRREGSQQAGEELAAEALRESERMLSTLLSNLPGMAYRCLNSPDWPMEFVSEGSLALTGYPAAALTRGRQAFFQQIIHPDDRDLVWNRVQTAVRARVPYQFTYRILTATGQEKWVWEQGRGVFDGAGELLALEGFMTDITNRVQAQQTLEQRVQERTRELSTLLEVSRNVGSTLELEPLLDLILEQLRAVVEYSSASILRTGSEQVRVQAYRGPIPHDEALCMWFPIDRTHLRQVLLGLQPVIIPDLHARTPLADEFWSTPPSSAQIWSLTRSWLGVPLVVRDRVVGMLSLSHQEPAFYTQEHERLVLAFANEAALAIDNAELYEGARRRVAEIESLQRVTTALLQKLTLDQVLDVVYREARQLTGASGCALFFWDGGPWLDVAQWGGVLQPTGSRVPVDETFAGQVVRSGEPLIVNDPRQLAGTRHFQAGLESLLVIPMRLHGSTVGALDVANKPGGFGPDDVRFLGLFADAAAIAIESARLNEKASQLAVLEERQRLARELHDSVTQALYTVALYAEASRLALSSGKLDVVADNLQQLHDMAREAMLDMRMLIFELHPPLIEKEGLVGALQARLAAVEARAGLQTEIHAEGERRLALPVETELFWIALEACNNVVKHAGAQRLVVRFAFAERGLRLEIEDDGRGFDPRPVRHGGGLGLRGIEERVQRIHGRWQIDSTPGQGTRVRVEVDV